MATVTGAKARARARARARVKSLSYERLLFLPFPSTPCLVLAHDAGMSGIPGHGFQGSDSRAGTVKLV